MGVRWIGAGMWLTEVVGKVEDPEREKDGEQAAGERRI
jgi:hypothetical protein